jgi:hypothetical protein
MDRVQNNTLHSADRIRATSAAVLNWGLQRLLLWYEALGFRGGESVDFELMNFDSFCRLMNGYQRFTWIYLSYVYLYPQVTFLGNVLNHLQEDCTAS